MKSIFKNKSKTVLFSFILFFLSYTVTAATLTSVELPGSSYKKLSYDTVTLKENFLLLGSAVNNLSVAEYQHLSGKKLTFKNKLRYLLIKHELKAGANHNSLLPSLEGFVLGLFLGPIGVLIAYLFSKDKKLRHAAIAGGIISIMLIILFVVIITSALGDISFSLFSNLI